MTLLQSTNRVYIPLKVERILIKGPENHHSSPQNPKNKFIHNKVVSPLLLTFHLLREAPRGAAAKPEDKSVSKSDSKTKSPILERMGL
jgi:hypothetical protein